MLEGEFCRSESALRLEMVGLRDATMLGWLDAMGFRLAPSYVLDAGLRQAASREAAEPVSLPRGHGRGGEVDLGAPQANGDERMALDRPGQLTQQPNAEGRESTPKTQKVQREKTIPNSLSWILLRPAYLCDLCVGCWVEAQGHARLASSAGHWRRASASNTAPASSGTRYTNASAAMRSAGSASSLASQ